MTDLHAPTPVPALVSVIIAAYEQPTLLNAALASIAAQTYQPIEIVIVDDASSPAARAQYQLPPNACLIVLPQRRGTAAISRNTGIAVARGEFIAFLDQDDLWHPEKIARQVAALLAHPIAALHYTHYQRVHESLTPFPEQDRPHLLGPDPLAALLRRNRIHCPSQVMMRRTAIDALAGFDESIRGAADWDMWLRAAAYAPLLQSLDPLVSYRHHAAQWSRQNVMMARGSLAVMTKARQWIPEKRPDLRALARRRCARWWRELGRVSLQTPAEAPHALAHLRRAARLWPFDPRLYLLMLRAVRPSTASTTPTGTSPDADSSL